MFCWPSINTQFDDCTQTSILLLNSYYSTLIVNTLTNFEPYFKGYMYSD